MGVATPRARARLGVAIGAAFFALACDFDWTVGGGRVDAGGADASEVGAAVADAGAGADALERDAVESDLGPPSDAMIDGGGQSDGGDRCAELAAAEREARERARRCTLGSNHCATTVADSCGCLVFVAVAGSQDATAFNTAARAYNASGCTLAHCAACPSPMPAMGTCLEQGAPNPMPLCWP